MHIIDYAPGQRQRYVAIPGVLAPMRRGLKAVRRPPNCEGGMSDWWQWLAVERRPEGALLVSTTDTVQMRWVYGPEPDAPPNTEAGRVGADEPVRIILPWPDFSTRVKGGVVLIHHPEPEDGMVDWYDKVSVVWRDGASEHLEVLGCRYPAQHPALPSMRDGWFDFLPHSLDAMSREGPRIHNPKHLRSAAEYLSTVGAALGCENFDVAVGQAECPGRPLAMLAHGHGYQWGVVLASKDAPDEHYIPAFVRKDEAEGESEAESEDEAEAEAEPTTA